MWLVGFLLLNLEWHYVISADTAGSTEHTNSRELFASEVYTRSGRRQSEGSLSEQFMSSKTESSTVGTEIARVSASDFSPHMSSFPFTHVSDPVSYSIVNSNGSLNPSTTQVMSHSVSNSTHFYYSTEEESPAMPKVPPWVFEVQSDRESLSKFQFSPTQQTTMPSSTSHSRTTVMEMVFNGSNSNATHFSSTQVTGYLFRNSYSVSRQSVEETTNSSVSSTSAPTAMMFTNDSSYSTAFQSTEIFSSGFSDVSSASPAAKSPMTFFAAGTSSTTPYLTTKKSDFITYSNSKQYPITHRNMTTVSFADISVNTSSNTQNSTESFLGQNTEMTHNSQGNATTACPLTSMASDVLIDMTTSPLLTDHTSNLMSTSPPFWLTNVTETYSSSGDRDTTLCPPTVTTFSSADMSGSNTTSYPSLKQTNANASSLPAVPESASASSDSNTTPSPPSQKTFSFADVRDSNATYLALDQTTSNTSSPCLLTHITETSSVTDDTNTTFFASTQTTFSSADVSVSSTTLYLTLEQTTANTSSPCPLTHITETSSSSGDSDTTPCPPTQTTFSSADVNDSTTTSYPSLELTTVNTSSPCLLTHITETTATRESDTTFLLTTHTTFGLVDVNNSSTSRASLEQTTANTSSPYPLTHVTETSATGISSTTPYPPTQMTFSCVDFSDSNTTSSLEHTIANTSSMQITETFSSSGDRDTTPCPPTQMTLGSVDVSNSNATFFSSLEQTTANASSPYPLTHIAETSFSSGDRDTTPCPPTQTTFSSADDSDGNTTSYPSLEPISVNASSPCPLTHMTETSASGDIDTTPCPPTQTTFSSVSVRDSKTTLSPLLELITANASSPCPLTNITETYSGSSDSDTTLGPSTEAGTSSPTVSNVTTPGRFIEEKSSTSRQPTYGTDVSSTWSDAGTTCCPSSQLAISSATASSLGGRDTSSKMRIPSLSTGLSYGTVTDATGHHTTYSSIKVTAIFSSMPPIEDLTGDLTSVSSFHKTSGTVTDTRTSTPSMESTVISAASVQLSVLPNSSTTSSSLATSASTDMMQSSEGDTEFTSACCSSELTVETTAIVTDTSTTEVPDTVSVNTSEMLTAEDISSFATPDVSLAETTLASPVIGSTLLIDIMTQPAITTDYTTSEYGSKLPTAMSDSASASPSETKVDTSATLKPIYSTGDVTTTSKYAQLTSFKAVPSTTSTVNPLVRVSSETLMSYSAGTQSPVVSMQSTDNTVETEVRVTTTVTPTVDMAVSSVTLTDVYVSFLDAENTTAATTSIVTDSLPGDFIMQ